LACEQRPRTGKRTTHLKNHARNWIGRLTIIGAGVIAIILVWKLLPIDTWLSVGVWRMFDLGNWGILIYFALYVLLVCLTFPATPLNVAAGILFPFWLGAAVALVAGFVAATASFLFIRFVAGDRIRSRLSRLPNYDDVMKLMKNAGLQIVFLVRINPFIPASLKNYGFSLAGIPLRTYVLGTVLGQTPVTLAHVYLGWAGGIAMMAGNEQLDTRNYVQIGIGATLSVAVLILISWYGRQKSKTMTGD
jgi:uncharacterized membrane protein YdjX (TVP38/TMEM64 family)